MQRNTTTGQQIAVRYDTSSTNNKSQKRKGSQNTQVINNFIQLKKI